MKLGELLEEVKIGTENYKEIKTIEQIQNSFNEDNEDYKISELLNIHLQKMLQEENDEKITKNIKNSILKISNIEERQETSNFISESYARMKYDSLKKVYNDIISLMENKKISKNVEKEVLANALGLIKFKIEEMAEISKTEVSLNESNETFQPFINKEYKIIHQAMN
jgi:hypothetical protein